MGGVKTTCLIDNGAHVNLLTSEYVNSRNLDMGLIQDLNNYNWQIPPGSCWGIITEPLGYIIIWVQIAYVPSYNEEQVALIVQDDSTFIKKCPVGLGTPMIK